MGMALAAYAGTMAAALTMLMVLWNGIIGSPQLERAREQPHPLVAIAAPDTAETPAKPPQRWGPAVVHKAPDGVDMANAEATHVAAARDTAAKAKRHKFALWQTRKQQELARAREAQDYSAALGYRNERLSYSQTFNPFGPSHF